MSKCDIYKQIYMFPIPLIKTSSSLLSNAVDPVLFGLLRIIAGKTPALAAMNPAKTLACISVLAYG